MTVAETIKSNVEQVGRAFEEFKTDFVKNQKDRDGLTEEKLKRMSDDIGKLHEQTVNLQDQIKLAADRPAFVADPEEVKAAKADAELFCNMRRDLQVSERKYLEPDTASLSPYRKAFDRYCRVGADMLSPEHRKDMSVGSDPDGGYFILPPTMAATIVTRVFESTPMRALASQITIGTEQYTVPEDPNEIGAGWVAETGTRSASTTPQVAKRTITPEEMYSMPQVTQKMLEDGMINIEQYLANKIADKFARLEATAFVAGTGVGQPRGFTTYTSGTTWGSTIEQVVSGNSSNFTYNGLINIMTSLKDKFHANANWLIKRASIASIMQLTDGSNRLIFQPIQGGNFNNTPLLGYPIRYANDMTAVAANALAAAFGDFKAGYLIVDRIGISTVRDNLTNKPYVLFYTRKRVGGDVVDFDAIKIQKIST